ncbi:MAG: hypothetical protein K2F63_00395 [Muribaculaceae bacterium]|nr:hypothetical protein [Muribaculaceae bacterium]MDE6135143.1 hypothetical protein [Muribaculaceae bacterium]
MEDIRDIFISIIKQSDSIDIAEAEFKRFLVDDESLRKLYREYCREIGSSEKSGFLDFCEEYLQGQDTIWESLSDYDEKE